MQAILAAAKSGQKQSFHIWADVMSIVKWVGDDHPQARHHRSHASQLVPLQDRSLARPGCVLLASVLSEDAAEQLAVHRNMLLAGLVTLGSGSP